MVKLEEQYKNYVITHRRDFEYLELTSKGIPNWRKITNQNRDDIINQYNNSTNDVPEGYVWIYHVKDSSVPAGFVKTIQGVNMEVSPSKIPLNDELRTLINNIPNWDTIQPYPWDDNKNLNIYNKLDPYLDRRVSTLPCFISNFVFQLPKSYPQVNRITDMRRLRKTDIKPIPLNRYALLNPTNPILPYVWFSAHDNEYDKNCIVSYLLKFFNMNPKKASYKISEKSIRNMLGSSPVVEDLIRFVERYQIKSKIYDVFARLVYSSDGNNERHQMVIMVFNQHVYEYTKGGNPDFLMDREISNLPGLSMSCGKKDYTAEDEAFFSIMKSISPNFSPKTQEHLFPRALMYSRLVNPDLEQYKCVDLKKAYYNSLYKSNGDNKIGVWTLHDDIKPYNKSEIVDHWYYFMKDIPNVPTNPRSAYINNVITGYEFRFMLEEGLITKSDITHMKPSSGFITVKDVRSLISSIETEVTQKDHKIFEGFSVYNGLLGKCYTNCKYLQFDIKGEEDLGILAMKMEGLSFIPKDQTDTNYSVRCDIKPSEYMAQNNKNIYSYIVSMCNINVMKLALLYIRAGYPIYRIYTDDIVTDYNAPLLSLDAKEKPLKKAQVVTEYVRNVYDMNEVISDTKLHYKVLTQNTKMLRGAPGTGKTTIVKKTFKADIEMAYTNVACRNMETIEGKADTINSTFRTHDPKNLMTIIKRLSKKRIWLDEFSQVPASYWNLLYMVLLKNPTEIMITGDENQLAAVSEPCDYKSMFMATLFEKSEVLTVDYRNDKDIIKLRENVINMNRTPLIESLKYSKIFDTSIDTHICMSNKLRYAINTEICKVRKIQKDSPGAILVAVRSKKTAGIYRQGRYKYVKKVGDKHVLESFTGVMIEANDEDFKRFEFGYAITAHSSQGLTIADNFAIYEIEQMINIRKSIFYTAITRGVKLSNIKLYRDTAGLELTKIEDKINDYSAYSIPTYWD